MLFTSLLILYGTIVSVHSMENKIPAFIEANKTQLDIATNFLSQLDLYLIGHYNQYRLLLDSVSPSLLRTQSDRECLHLLKYAFQNPLRHKWTAKCKFIFSTFKPCPLILFFIVLDSSGSLLSPGLQSGTYISFGDFDSCLAIDSKLVTDDGEQPIKVQGKHCFATVRLPADAVRQIDYQYSSLFSIKNESWPALLAKRWTEVDVRFPISQSLCLPSVCEVNFIREVILDGSGLTPTSVFV